MRPPPNRPRKLVSPPTTSASRPTPRQPAAEPAPATPDFATEVAKSVADTLTTALENQSATFRETIAKQATVIEGQAAELEQVKKRVEEIAEQPAAPKVFTNGATPPPGTVARPGPGRQPVDVAKAQELKRTLYTGTAGEQNKAFADMQQMAIDKLADMHAQRR